MPKRQWYRITAETGGVTADIWIYDIIGTSWFEDSVSAKQFLDELKALPENVKTIRLHINSPGGSPFDATAMHNLLRAQATEKGRTIEVLIEGLAASAATVVTSAGDSVKIARNALMMVHNAQGFALGDAADMRQMADALDTVGKSIIASYQRLSDLSEKDLQALMDAVTWMDAEEAIANGFATEIIEPVQIAASFDPRSVQSLGKIPKKFRARVAELTRAKDSPEPDPEPEPDQAEALDVLTAVEAAGLDTAFAREMIAAALPMAGVTARIEGAVQARAQAKTREDEIRALCTVAKCPELAAGYIKDGASVESVKAHLTTITAKLHKAEIDAGLPPDDGSTRKGTPRIDTVGIYAERNKPQHYDRGR